MRSLKHQDLVKLYKEGENSDNYIYAEQRSNLMLVSGNHYARKDSIFWGRLRDTKNLSHEQKLRLTKNHIQRICKIYENNILTQAPGVNPSPKNESELQDQKAAELCNSVWHDIKYRHRFDDRTREFVQDFVRIGETYCKIFWDETKGQFLGYEKAVDELGQPILDEMGQPVDDTSKPKFSGDLVFERVFAFNVFRAQEAKSLDESWFVGLRKMVDIDDLKARVGDDEEKLKFIQESRDETYQVFDGQSSSYQKANNQCLVLEVFIRPCMHFPKGHYYIYTTAGVLFEGELPFGVFPIVYVGFDEVPTNPRHHSIIKHLRPYQGEINRASSKMAEHQITLGDDKLLIQAGTKLQNGSTFPGIRAYQYSGQAPQILQGRAGDQYLAYIEQQIQEMYTVANLQEDLEEKPIQMDPYNLLFLSAKQKKKYIIYVQKFSRFLRDICETSLSLYRQYVTDDSLIPVIGRSEFVNIAEFKNTTPLNYQIVVEEGSEDMETKVGRQLFFNNILQYVGSNLDPKDIGKLIRIAPYANTDEALSDFTLDYDNATNMILSLDRGEAVQPDPNDDPKYMMRRLVSRMRKADFKFLSPEIQGLYQQVYNIYVEIEADQQRKIQEAALGFIPMQGMAVVCDLYVPMPGNSGKTQRARVPYDSLTWLLKRLEEQGMSQDAIMQQQQGVVADIAQKLLDKPAVPEQVDPAMAVQPQITPQ